MYRSFIEKLEEGAVLLDIDAKPMYSKQAAIGAVVAALVREGLISSRNKVKASMQVHDFSPFSFGLIFYAWKLNFLSSFAFNFFSFIFIFYFLKFFLSLGFNCIRKMFIIY